ncbi:MAG: T9SS type A sorting domain-containing protein [Bacteroidales bacterium]|nr:T9SS type A sorting domain-containing protein [Bacteroidales bacterium]
MKKLLLILVTLLMGSAMMAQTKTTILSESFSGLTMPSGWSIMGMGTSNWSVSATQNAGGAANELYMAYSPTFNGISRLTSPAVDLTGVQSAIFSFKHYLDNYSGSHILGIATSSDGGTTWNTAWQQNYSSDGRYSVVQNITTSDFGKENVKFCVFYQGNSYNFDAWYFDDIEVFTQENLDIKLASLTLPAIVSSSDVSEVNFTVSNLGVTPITSFEASYQINDEEPVVESFPCNVASLNNATFHFVEPITVGPGSYQVTMRILSVNGVQDDDTSNNEATVNMSCAYGSTDRTPLFEHFSASTCPPCVQANTVMNNFCNNNLGRFAYVKYPMNWPGSGDPYYTAEGGVRRGYYGVSGVPSIFLDGNTVSYSGIQGIFNNEALVPSYADIQGFFTVDGTTVNISFDVMAYVGMENVKMYVCVNEKLTTGNVGTNGETSFHHIMMKMVPNAQGTTISLDGCEVRHFDFTQNMTSTNVEEMDDLEVVVFLQNNDTKEVYNSAFLREDGFYAAPVGDLIVTFEDDKATGVATASWSAPAGSTPLYYKVTLDGVVVEEEYTELSYDFDVVDGDFHIIEVQAIYEDCTSVSMVSGVNYVWSTPEVQSSCRLFPNPANGQVFIQANENIDEIRVYNTLGVLVNTIPANGSSQSIDLANFANGIYFIQMNTESGASVTRRLVVSH